eukprot:6371843-Prymnesium_polylepis.1
MCPASRSRRGGILGAGALASYGEQEAVARATARPWRADMTVASERRSARPQATAAAAARARDPDVLGGVRRRLDPPARCTHEL